MGGKPVARRPLFAGFAKTDITPREPLGMDLYGMPRPYPGARGVLDRLYVRACYLESGSRRLLLVECDLEEILGHKGAVMQGYGALLEKLAVAGGLSVRDIWLCATHCHSSAGVATGPFQTKVLERYRLRLETQIIEVGRRAIESKRQVKIGCGQAPVEGVAGNRRVKLSDGVVITGWGDGPSPPPGVRLVERGPVDNDVGLVMFRDLEDRPVGALVNFNSHIHAYPVLYFTSELAGAVTRRLESRMPGLTAVYTTGAEGDVSLCEHTQPLPNDPRPWNRIYRREMRRIAGRLVDAIVGLQDRMTYQASVAMCAAHTTLAVARAGSRLPVKTISAVTINDLALVAEEDECFVRYARELKSRSPFPSTFVVGLRGPVCHYFVPTDALDEGGYETYTPQPRGSFEQAIAAAGALLQRMRGRSGT